MSRRAREPRIVHVLAVLAMASCGPPGAAEPVRAPAPIESPALVPMTVAPVAPPPAGPASEQAATARRLFDAQRWSEAAPALHDVASGKTPDTVPSKQFAQYELAIALYHMGLLQLSYAVFSEIADKPNHADFNDTPPWLATLATELPEPADVVERVGKYSDEQLARFDTPDQREAYWHLCYLRGQYDFRNRQYEDAIRWYARVDPRSRYHAQALFLSGMSSVQLRKSVPAVQFFEKVVAALDAGAVAPDDGRMRDLAYLSLARTYYSAAITLDAPTRTLKSKPEMLSATVKPVVRAALSDRRLLDHLEYVRALDRESARLRAAPQAFQDSEVGEDARDAIVLARNLAVRNGGELAKERIQRSLDELADHLRTGSALQAAIAAAGSQAVAAGQHLTGTVGDLDAQTITSRCPR